MRAAIVISILVAVVILTAICLHVWQESAPAREARRLARLRRGREMADEESAEDYYRQLQQAVRLLELIRVRDDELLAGALSEDHRAQADLIVRRFYRDRPGEIEAKG